MTGTAPFMHSAIGINFPSIAKKLKLKGAKFSFVEKKLIVQNRKRLMENLPEPINHPPPLSNGISARQSKIQMDKLVQLSKERSISKDSSRSHPTKNTDGSIHQCPICGFLPTQEMLEHVKSIPLLPGEQCIQCSELRVQKEKRDAKDFCLARLFCDQLKPRTNYLDHEELLKVSMDNFLRQNTCQDFAKSILPAFPSVQVSAHVLHCNIYTDIKHHNKL